jgi:hypothetical protein
MKIAVNTLPGLSDIANGYEYDTVTNEVTSTRVNSRGAKMWGSYTKGYRVYTFMLKAGYKTSYRVSMSVTEARLRLLVKDTKPVSSKKAVSTKSTAVAEHDITKGWIIGSVNGNVMSISETPKVHVTESSVKSEIERLAKAYPGKTFVKMKIENFVKATGVSWI